MSKRAQPVVDMAAFLSGPSDNAPTAIEQRGGGDGRRGGNARRVSVELEAGLYKRLRALGLEREETLQAMCERAIERLVAEGG